MSCVHAILYPVAFTVSRVLVPVQEFNRYVAEAEVCPQLLLHGIVRCDLGDGLSSSVCNEIQICSMEHTQ